MKKLVLLFLFQFIVFICMAQSVVMGKVTDEDTGEKLIYACLVFNKNGVFAAATSTDFNGNYFIPIDPGIYEVSIRYIGYSSRIISNVFIKSGQTTKIDFVVHEDLSFCQFTETNYKIPLVEIDHCTTEQTITSDKIKTKSSKSITQLILDAPGVSVSNF